MNDEIFVAAYQGGVAIGDEQDMQRYKLIPDEARQVAELLLAAAESAETGQPVTVPNTEFR